MSNKQRWTQEELDKALEAIKNKMSLRQASRLTGIPRRTLGGYISRNNTHKCVVGRKPVLSLAQEEELVVNIKRLASIGYPLTAKSIRLCVYQFCSKNNIPNPFNDRREEAGRYWYEGFMKRHKDGILKSQKLNLVRAQKLNRADLNERFESLQKVLDGDCVIQQDGKYEKDEKPEVSIEKA